jgi:polysaccharide biosynthesis/export protein
MNRIASSFPRVIALAAILLLTACAGPNYSKVPAVPTDFAPVAPPAENLMPYRFQIGDVLELKFYLNPEFDETVTVRPDGLISTKIIDSLKVYDRTVDDVTKDIKKRYKKELKDPKVTTIVRSFAPIRVYVSGEVNTPGEFVVVGQAPTLTQAIARAGGIKNSGEGDKVLIIRRGAGEKGKVFLANYDGATQGGNPALDARLAPYDVVFVPKSGAAQAYKGYEQYVKQFISPSIGVGYSIN